jgi:hypothetical protein
MMNISFHFFLVGIALVISNDDVVASTLSAIYTIFFGRRSTRVAAGLIYENACLVSLSPSPPLFFFLSVTCMDLSAALNYFTVSNHDDCLEEENA